MATHSSTLALKIPRMEEPCRLQSTGRKESDTTEQLHLHFTTIYGNIPLISLMAQMVKYLPSMWEIRVRSLGWEDSLEKEMATHSSTLVWKIPWTEEPSRLQSVGLQRVRHD